MVDLGSGFDFHFASAFGVYFDFALEVESFYALEVDFGLAFRVVLGADGVANILSRCSVEFFHKRWQESLILHLLHF